MNENEFGSIVHILFIPWIIKVRGSFLKLLKTHCHEL